MRYAQAFNHLCQYAGYHANTDAKKRDRFRRGLNTKLKERLNLVKTNTFNELVNMAITKKIAFQPTGLRRSERYPLDPRVLNPRGIG
jgi:hypothetical protein